MMQLSEFSEWPFSAGLSRGAGSSALFIPFHARVHFHENGALLLDLQAGRVYTTNASGAFILKAILEKLHPARLPAAVSEAFGLSAEAGERDVLDFLGSLLASGMLTAGPAHGWMQSILRRIPWLGAVVARRLEGAR